MVSVQSNLFRRGLLLFLSLGPPPVLSYDLCSLEIKDPSDPVSSPPQREPCPEIHPMLYGARNLNVESLIQQFAFWPK
jgi:hypothetical protein